MVANTAPAEMERLAVFISYSRRDSSFRARLADALQAHGYRPIYDKSARQQDDPDFRLTAQDEWWSALKTMIAACDVMVFVVTPDSAASAVCDDEIAHARNLGKRVIAVRRRDIDFNKAPERLRALNVAIDFLADDDDAFDAAMTALMHELDVDMAWHRRGARLMRLAHQWDADGRPDGQLLRLGAIAEADDWATKRPAGASELGALLLDFLNSSRAREAADDRERRRVVGRAFVKPARQAFDAGHYDRALRLMAAGIVLSEDFDLQLVPQYESEALLRRAVGTNPLRVVLHGHTGEVTGVSFSRDGRRVATSSADHTVRIWDSATGEEVARLPRFKFFMSSVALSPDGAQLAATSWDSTARIWDIATGREVRQLVAKDHQTFTGAVFAPNGTSILTASTDAIVRLWALPSGEELLQLHGHANTINAAVFSPDASRIATASADYVAGLWDTASGTCIGRLGGHTDIVNSVAFSASGSQVVTSSRDKTARIWDASTGREIMRLEGHEYWLTGARFCGDGSLVATVSWDRTARIWEVETGRCLVTLRGHEDRLSAMDVNCDGTRVATASADHTVRIWDAAVGLHIGSVSNFDILLEGRKLSPDGTRITADQPGAEVIVLDCLSKAEILRFAATGEKITRAGFSSDGQRIFTKTNVRRVLEWDAQSTVALLSDGTATRVPAVILAAALDAGRGLLSASEREDLLLQSAQIYLNAHGHRDLYAAVMAALTAPEREDVRRRTQLLSKSSHTNRYMSPSRLPMRSFEPSELLPNDRPDDGALQRR